ALEMGIASAAGALTGGPSPVSAGPASAPAGAALGAVQSVVLRRDGRLEFVDTAAGRSTGFLDPGIPFRHAIPNTRNDVAIVATDNAELWAFRPAGAGPVDVTSFRPPATQPSTRPAQT